MYFQADVAFAYDAIRVSVTALQDMLRENATIFDNVFQRSWSNKVELNCTYKNYYKHCIVRIKSLSRAHDRTHRVHIQNVRECVVDYNLNDVMRTMRLN